MGKDDTLTSLIEDIDDQIQAIDNHKVVRQAEKLLEKKRRLQGARRALLGAGPKMTGGSGGGNRVTQAEVVEFMRKEGYIGDHTIKATLLAEQMGHDESVLRGHLNRGRDERFTQHEDKSWSLRDPKSEEQDEDE